MKISGRDIFGIMVRVCGLCVLLFLLWNLSLGIGFLCQLPLYREYFGAGGSFISVVEGTVGFIIAVALLRFARQIVRFSYPKNKDDTDA
jgi:hypothetical protein